VYKEITGVEDDYNGITVTDTTYLAVFPLDSEGEFPVVSFYARNVSEKDFLEIVDSVNLE